MPLARFIKAPEEGEPGRFDILEVDGEDKRGMAGVWQWGLNQTIALATSFRLPHWPLKFGILHLIDVHFSTMTRLCCLGSVALLKALLLLRMTASRKMSLFSLAALAFDSGTIQRSFMVVLWLPTRSIIASCAA